MRKMYKHKQHYSLFLNIRDLKWIANVQESNLILLRDFLNSIDPVVYYMLEGRFAKAPAKIKRNIKIPNTPELNRVLSALKVTRSIDRKKQNINFLDIVKAFKQLEQQIYHNGYIPSDAFDDLELGQYKANIVKSSDSLTTLLLSIPHIPEAEARAILSYAHTGVCIYRQFNVKAKPDSSTITGRYTGTMVIDEVIKKYFNDYQIDAFLDKFLDRSKLNNFDQLFIYSGNASSPNSGHSNVRYLDDVIGLYKDPELYTAVLSLAECFKNGSSLVNIVETLVEATASPNETNYPDDKEHSRIVTFTAPGGKARIIAVADWITQSALSCIHRTQFQLLEMIPADRTFAHKTGLDIYEANADNYISVDLSAATDRLPRVLQAKIINRLFTKLGLDGPKIEKYWLQSIDRSYSTRSSYLEAESPYIKYEVGQGMGLFSSWSSMALLHHYIVSDICKVPQDNYRLVGDDLLLKNALEEYGSYCNFCEAIGVRINQQKTLVSSERPHTLEFARNYIISGQKISPLPVGVIFSYQSNKTSESEVFFNFLDTLDFHDISLLLKEYNITDFKELHVIAYFLWREKRLSYSQINSIINKLGHPNLLMSEEAMVAIERECATTPTPSSTRKQILFVESLLSQCTMRREEDLMKITSLGEDFHSLKYFGEGIQDYADVMMERILNATSVTYLPGLGNPTASKLERRTIYDYLTYLKETDKTIKPLLTKKRKQKKIE